MDQEYIEGFEELNSVLRSSSDINDLSPTAWNSISTFLSKTITENEFEIKCGDVADTLIDETISVLNTTQIVDARVFEHIAKLSCFYGTNVRAFLVLTNYVQKIDQFTETTVIDLLLNRILKNDDYSWKMAKLCCVLVSKFVELRREAARVIVNRNNVKFRDILLGSYNFTLKCYFTELVKLSVPERVKTQGPSFLARTWQPGPSFLWENMPPPPAASKAHISYIAKLNTLTKSQPDPKFFMLSSATVHLPAQKQRFDTKGGCFHIFDDAIILWKSAEDNPEIFEPIELFISALVKVVKNSYKQQQLSFVAPTDRVAGGNLIEEWQSIIIVLEFETEDSEKSALRCILDTIDQYGFRRPEMSGIYTTKMSVSSVVLNLSVGKPSQTFKRGSSQSRPVSLDSTPEKEKKSTMTESLFPPIEYEKEKISLQKVQAVGTNPKPEPAHQETNTVSKRKKPAHQEANAVSPQHNPDPTLATTNPNPKDIDSDNDDFWDLASSKPAPTHTFSDPLPVAHPKSKKQGKVLRRVSPPAIPQSVKTQAFGNNAVQKDKPKKGARFETPVKEKLVEHDSSEGSSKDEKTAAKKRMSVKEMALRKKEARGIPPQPIKDEQPSARKMVTRSRAKGRVSDRQGEASQVLETESQAGYQSLSPSSNDAGRGNIILSPAGRNNNWKDQKQAGDHGKSDKLGNEAVKLNRLEKQQTPTSLNKNKKAEDLQPKVTNLNTKAEPLQPKVTNLNTKAEPLQSEPNHVNNQSQPANFSEANIPAPTQFETLAEPKSQDVKPADQPAPSLLEFMKKTYPAAYSEYKSLQKQLADSKPVPKRAPVPDILQSLATPNKPAAHTAGNQAGTPKPRPFPGPDIVQLAEPVGGPASERFKSNVDPVSYLASRLKTVPDSAPKVSSPLAFMLQPDDGSLNKSRESQAVPGSDADECSVSDASITLVQNPVFSNRYDSMESLASAGPSLHMLWGKTFHDRSRYFLQETQNHGDILEAALALTVKKVGKAMTQHAREVVRDYANCRRWLRKEGEELVGTKKRYLKRRREVWVETETEVEAARKRVKEFVLKIK